MSTYQGDTHLFLTKSLWDMIRLNILGKKMKTKKYTHNPLQFIKNHRKTSTTSFLNRYSNIWKIILHVLILPCFLILISRIPNQKLTWKDINWRVNLTLISFIWKNQNESYNITYQFILFYISWHCKVYSVKQIVLLGKQKGTLICKKKYSSIKLYKLNFIN